MEDRVKAQEVHQTRVERDIRRGHLRLVRPLSPRQLAILDGLDVPDVRDTFGWIPERWKWRVVALYRQHPERGIVPAFEQMISEMDATIPERRGT